MDNIILEMIRQNKSTREICEKLKISEKQFFVRIKRIIKNGNILEPSFYYNSDIEYVIQNELSFEQKNNINITLPNNQCEFKFIVISDLHIGNRKFNMDLVKKVYEYAAKIIYI